MGKGVSQAARGIIKNTTRLPRCALLSNATTGMKWAGRLRSNGTTANGCPRASRRQPSTRSSLALGPPAQRRPRCVAPGAADASSATVPQLRDRRSPARWRKAARDCSTSVSNQRVCGLDNARIARILREIADLLEIKNENTFKIRAYRNAGDI